MKTVVRLIGITFFFLVAAAGVTFLMAPYVIDSYILPRLLEKIAVIDKSTSISRITPYSTRGTFSFDDGEMPVASIPHFELRYTPTSLFNQKISSLTIDHATIHLVKDDNGVHIAGVSGESANHAASDSVHVPPLLFPGVIESLILKQCSVILHEPGQTDMRFTLSSRIHFTFDDKSSSGFALLSAQGAFLIIDSMSAKGHFSLVSGPDEHTVSVNLQTELSQLTDHFTGRENIIAGSMLMEASAVMDAKDLQINKVTAAGTIKKFQLKHKKLILQGGETDETVSFSLSGSPQNLEYQLGTVAINQALGLRTTITGTGKYTGRRLQAKGTINNSVTNPINGKDGPLSAPLTYDLQLDTNSLGWQANVTGEYRSKQQRTLSHGDVSLLLPDITLNSSLTGNREEINGTIDFMSKPLSINRGESSLDISEINLTVQLQTSPRLNSLHLSGSIAGIKYPAAGVEIETLRLDLPYHFPFTPGHEQPEGSLTLDSVIYNNSPLATVSAALSQHEDSLHLSGSVGSLFSDNMKLQVNGTVKQTPLQAHLAWALDKAPISATILPPAVPIAAGLDFNGTLASSGSLLYQNRRISGDALVNLEIESLQMPEKDITIQNISCGVDFPNLPAFSSMPSQHCSAGQLAFGNLQFSDAKVDFRVENLDTVFIEKSSVRWCQGKLESTSLRLSRSKPEINTALYCSKINFSDLLNQFGLDQADGEGSLNGKLPIALSKDGLSFDDGFLFSTPGTGGIIRFSNTDMLRQGVAAADVGGYLDYSMKAMEDFSYQWTKLSFNSSGDELQLTMELNGKPRSPLPYGFKNGMIIETNKGEGLQYPIRLDVNFRLPLAELFQIGQNIQSIKEKM